MKSVWIQTSLNGHKLVRTNVKEAGLSNQEIKGVYK